MLDPLRAFAALSRTIQYLYAQAVIVAVLSVLLTLLAVLKASKADWGDNFRTWLFSKFSSSLAFASLGFALAYLLSLGVNAEGGANPVLTQIVTPLVPLITAGIVYVESNGNAPGVQPRTGIIAFLISFAVCFQTLYYQITYHW